MKKSKIIVPALGILVLSTAASITGTVAWFTAQNTFNTTVSDFALVRTNGDLKCTLGAGLGTTKTGDNIGTTSNYKLSDGSFDHGTKKIIAPDRTGRYVGANIALDDANTTVGDADSLVRQVKSGVTALTAMTFTMAFELDFGATDSNYALYFDASASKIYKTSGQEDQSDVDATDTIHGFRMAFVGTTATYTTTKVWADLQTNANSKYVSGSLTKGTALAGTSYSGGLMDSECVLGVPASSQTSSDAASTLNYLGKFVFAANTTVTLNYTVVCWFEGTDPTINNDADDDTDFDSVTADIHFEIKALTD